MMINQLTHHKLVSVGPVVGALALALLVDIAALISLAIGPIVRALTIAPPIHEIADIAGAVLVGELSPALGV